jgi:cell division protein FtsN
MSRDYKYRTTSRRRRKSAPVVWLAAGLAMGLFVAFLLYVKMRGDTTNVQTAETQAEPIALPPEQPAEQPVAAAPPVKEKSIPPPPASRFIFYEELPQMKVEAVIPEQEIKGEKKEGVRQVKQPGLYLLQAGSFRNPEQAEQLKAKLALLGLETRVQASDDGSGDKWHRVRVGPYKNLRELNKARTLLQKNGIQAILISLK